MKINVGRASSRPSALHRCPRRVETTSQFGFLQPTFARECAADDHIKIRNAAAVRLQPLAKPTFGRLFLRQYDTFVPIEEIYHPFGSFLAQKPYSGALDTYIPSEVPQLPIGIWSIMIQLCSRIELYKTSTGLSNIGTFQFNNDLTFDVPSSDQSQIINLLLDVLSDCGISSLGNFVSDLSYYVTSGLEPISKFISDSSTTFTPDRYDWIYISNTSSSNYDVYCGRLTERGKNLRKIWLGIGNQLCIESDSVNILKLGAYYKAWFDLFAVQREITWKQTNFHAFMEILEQDGSTLTEIINNQPLHSSGRNVDTFFFKWFFEDLPRCYYTQNPDWVSAQIVDGSLESDRTAFPAIGSDGTQLDYVTTSTDHELPEINSTLSQQSLDVLKKLYQRINIKTAIGGRIKTIMQALFGSDYKQDDDSNFVGSNSLTVDITDVMSTNESADVLLGEYAGQGKGMSSGDVLEFSAHRPGIYVSMFALIPETSLAQGVDPNNFHSGPFDFYNPDLDAVTLLPTRKLSVFGAYDIKIKGYSHSGGFGNIPNYSEYKTSFDTINGDMSMRSTRASLLPFSLAKLLPYGHVDDTTLSTKTLIHTGPSKDLLVAGDVWRYIGRDKWIGNFDRIFVNDGSSTDDYIDELNRRYDDNFICYLYHDCQVTGKEISMADSFQTDSFGDHLTVEKA